MSFCASCGRQRSGTARFCGGCGAEFSDGAAASGAPEAPEAPGAVAHDPTLLAVDPAGTRIDPPGQQADLFASWYQQETPAAGQGPETDWQPAQTAQSGSAMTAGYPSPPYPPSAQFPAPAPAAPFPPASLPPMAPPARGGGGRGLFIAVAVIAVLAAGGGAYALTTSLGKHSQSSAQPTVAASTPPAGGSTPAAPASPAASSSGSASPTLSPSPSLSLVAVSPGAASNTAKSQVETLLSHYFHGINTHSYAEYASTLNAAQLAKQSQSQFESGYSSTTDSGMTLTALTAGGGGDLTATVTFTSHQSPAQSIDNSACNAWTLNLYLVPQGTGYLIGPAPAGYQPTYSDC